MTIIRHLLQDQNLALWHFGPHVVPIFWRPYNAENLGQLSFSISARDPNPFGWRGYPTMP